MKIETRIVRHGYDGKQCHVHARGIFGARGAVITAQRLHLTECDVFDGIELIFSFDGVHFDEPIASRGLARRYFADGSSEVMADATPFYHKKTGKLILTGHRIRYGADNRLLKLAGEKGMKILEVESAEKQLKMFSQYPDKTQELILASSIGTDIAAIVTSALLAL